MTNQVIESIRQSLGYAEDDDMHDEEIENMSPDEQFQLYCEWNGLLGWSQTLKDVVLELFK